MHLVAWTAIRSLEQHCQRLAARATTKVVRRRHEERLIGETGTRRIAHVPGKPCAERGLPLVLSAHVVEHGLEPVRRIVTIEPRHDPALLVQKEKRRRELHIEAPRERL